MKYFLWSVMALLPALYCYGQDASFVAHSTATNNYSLNSNNVWNSACNPAGLTTIKKLSGGLFYQNHFLMKDLSSQYFTLIVPLNKVFFSGLSLFRFGNELFSKNQLSLSSGIMLNDKLSFGAQLYFQYVHQSEQNPIYYTFPELGMTYTISTQLKVSSSARNFTSNLSKEHKIVEPQMLRIGLSYEFDEKVKLHAQLIFQDRNYPFVGIGIDYFPKEKFYVGFNISSTNQPFNMGVGYKLKPIEIKIAFSYHQLLGVSPSSTITL